MVSGSDMPHNIHSSIYIVSGVFGNINISAESSAQTAQGFLVIALFLSAMFTGCLVTAAWFSGAFCFLNI